MSGCGKDKYLTKNLLITANIASKALISCIFPTNITNFCDFPEKAHVCTIKTFFPGAWKRPENVHCLQGKGYVNLTFPSELSSFFPVKKFAKKAVLNWFSNFPFRTYIYTTISIKKLSIKWFSNTEKQI